MCVFSFSIVCLFIVYQNFIVHYNCVTKFLFTLKAISLHEQTEKRVKHSGDRLATNVSNWKNDS